MKKAWIWKKQKEMYGRAWGKEKKGQNDTIKILEK